MNLIQAVYEGNVFRVQQLIDDGVNINTKDKFGMTPLILAADNGNHQIVKILLDSGAKDLKSKDHCTHCDVCNPKTSCRSCTNSY